MRYAFDRRVATRFRRHGAAHVFFCEHWTRHAFAKAHRRSAWWRLLLMLLATFGIANTSRSLHRILVLISDRAIRRLSYPYGDVLLSIFAVISNDFGCSCAVA